MSTLYDWVTMAIFAGLLVIFLQRSIGPRPDNDRIVNYLPPAIGCALANYVGNHGYSMLSVLLLVLVLAYIWFVIRPFANSNGAP